MKGLGAQDHAARIGSAGVTPAVGVHALPRRSASARLAGGTFSDWVRRGGRSQPPTTAPISGSCSSGLRWIRSRSSIALMRLRSPAGRGLGHAEPGVLQRQRGAGSVSPFAARLAAAVDLHEAHLRSYRLACECSRGATQSHRDCFSREHKPTISSWIRPWADPRPVQPPRGPCLPRNGGRRRHGRV